MIDDREFEELEAQLRTVPLRAPRDELDARVREALRAPQPVKTAGLRVWLAAAAALLLGAIGGFAAGRATAEPEVRTRTVVQGFTTVVHKSDAPTPLRDIAPPLSEWTVSARTTPNT